MEIKLTGISKENIEAFEPLLFGRRISGSQLAVGAIVDDMAVGAALFDAVDEILMLDYIYVSSEYRRKGIATKMINGLISEISFAEPSAIHVNFPGEAEDLLGLFLSLHFKLFRDGTSFSVSSDAFMQSDVMKKITSQKIRSRIIRVSEMTEKNKKTVRDAFEKADLFPNMAEDPALSKDLSIVSLDEKDVPRSCLLAMEGEDTVVIHYLVNFRNETAALLEIINAFSKLVEVKYKNGCNIRFVTMDEKMQAFVEKLVDDKELIANSGPVVSGTRTL